LAWHRSSRLSQSSRRAREVVYGRSDERYAAETGRAAEHVATRSRSGADWTARRKHVPPQPPPPPPSVGRKLFDDAPLLHLPVDDTIVFRAHPPPHRRPPKRVPRKPRTTTASFTARAAGRRHKYALSGVPGPAFEWISLFAFVRCTIIIIILKHLRERTKAPTRRSTYEPGKSTPPLSPGS